ncbi:CASP-like protein 4B1 [Phragmites australis]|uniref:CASP-like protein 4B1 n=1 Tax=Phragmites australis TaxID=29695 RepID=UPI002D773C8F|nr:CASP-like protein 4B1 [Phragmites australis]
MAMAVTSPAKGSGVASPPPPGVEKTNDSYNGHGAPGTRTAARAEHEDLQALDDIVLVLRAGAALAAFVAVALVASCRHGDWMEFARYQEYRYLLGASVVACVYSAAQALRNFRRKRGPTSVGFLDFAGDQVVAYLLITASSAALPITIRMRSAVINIFTDAMAAAISLGFIAFAALAFTAMLSVFRLSAQHSSQLAATNIVIN